MVNLPVYAIQDYNDTIQVRNCRLVGLRDLKGNREWVRDRIADYMSHLIDVGVAGFRIDAAKHMWPRDIYNILNRLHRLNTLWFPANTAPFVYQEVSLRPTYPYHVWPIIARIILIKSACLSLSIVNLLDSKGNYSAASNNMKLVHWPLMGGLLHLVQRGGAGPLGGLRPRPVPSSLYPNVTAHPSTASVPITVLLCGGPLLCGFNVAIKGLRRTRRKVVFYAMALSLCLLMLNVANYANYMLIMLVIPSFVHSIVSLSGNGPEWPSSAVLRTAVSWLVLVLMCR